MMNAMNLVDGLDGLAAGVSVIMAYGLMAASAYVGSETPVLMLAALAASFLFLCSYLTYHFFYHGFTRYQGEGILRPIYFFILLTHTPLAVLIVPFCVAAVYFAFKGNFKKHTAITRWLLPTWMYVSLTGVLIYFMLYVF
jgi:putative membrane protein